MTIAAIEIPGYRAGTWTIDPIHSYVGFAIRHLMLSTVRGQFESVVGEIVTAQHLTNSSVAVTIDAASFHTNNEERDEHIRSADFLDVKNYPNLAFKSAGIRSQDGFVIEGGLTIRGVTNPVTLRATPPQFGPNPHGTTALGISARTVIKRSDFDIAFNVAMPGGGFMLGEDVRVVLEVKANLNS